MVALGAADRGFAIEVAGLRDFLWEQAVGLVRNEMEADDLVHDTIERAFSHRHLFQPGTNLRAWTRSIMRNLFIDRWRRKPVYLELDADRTPDPSPEPFDLGPSPLDVLRLEDVRAAVQRLAPLDQMLFDQLHVQGASYREIAQRFGFKKLDTVGSRLFRIRQKLRAILEKTLAARAMPEVVAIGTAAREGGRPAARGKRPRAAARAGRAHLRGVSLPGRCLAPHAA